MANILVVEDERLIVGLLRETLESEGYQVATVSNGSDALQFALRETPHLVILDIMLPGIDGYEVIKQLRNHPKTMHVPIMVLSAMGRVCDRMRAYDNDVDGYITKPFDTDELLAHVRRLLRRVRQASLSPLTGLPGGMQVMRAIDYKLERDDPWSFLYLDLDNFKAFNDVYGFLAGNDMILLVGQICRKVVYEYGNADDFVGHVGGDDFIVVTTPEHTPRLCQSIVARYKEESASLYRPEDYRRGSISGVDRKGRPYQFPLISLSIGVVNSHVCRPSTIQEVSYLAAEAKRSAKQSNNNICYVSSHRSMSHHDERVIPSDVALAPSRFYTPSLMPYATSAHRADALLPFVERDVLAAFEQRV
jgi:diguanylate cyclase (GGDEF)-like protein